MYLPGAVRGQCARRELSRGALASREPGKDEDDDEQKDEREDEPAVTFSTSASSHALTDRSSHALTDALSGCREG